MKTQEKFNVGTGFDPTKTSTFLHLRYILMETTKREREAFGIGCTCTFRYGKTHDNLTMRSSDFHLPISKSFRGKIEQDEGSPTENRCMDGESSVKFFFPFFLWTLRLRSQKKRAALFSFLLFGLSLSGLSMYPYVR